MGGVYTFLVMFPRMQRFNPACKCLLHCEYRALHCHDDLLRILQICVACDAARASAISRASPEWLSSLSADSTEATRSALLWSSAAALRYPKLAVAVAAGSRRLRIAGSDGWECTVSKHPQS